MNEIITKDDIKIENMIYEIRGREVMLDSDLAKLYHVETKRINETVRRNSKRFPPDFYFQLFLKYLHLLIFSLIFPFFTSLNMPL